jgi:hypothetical protein
MWSGLAVFWFFMWLAARSRAEKAEAALATARKAAGSESPPQTWY